MYVNIYGAHYCKECGQELTKMHFTNLKNGFKDCCCATCTNLNKYGVENPSQLESVKQNKKEIWISILNNKQNKRNILKIDDCTVKYLNNTEAYDFLEKYHLFGSSNSKINIALCYNNEIVQIISIENKNNYFEITRIANKNGYFVKNGLKHLLNIFERNHEPNTIKFIGDKRFIDPIDIIDTLEPKGYYFKNVLELIEEKTTNLSEQEMYNLNFRKIYDAGHYIFIRELKNI